jgi:DNA-binding MarR family transcriptional regulator
VSEIKHRTVETNGIHMHIAESGAGPLVALCHGFPESWYSWRHQLYALAEAGFQAIAPDMRGYGLRTTQYSLLHILARAGQVRQGELGGPTRLDETTLTRNLRPLVAAAWVSVQSGDDRREKLVRITEAGAAKLLEARPAWERAQTRIRALLPRRVWQRLLAVLPDVAKLTAGP